jgi:hypothetical protein
MDWLAHELNRAVQQLLDRAGGPLNFRLLMMPTVVTLLAIRAGLRDARESRPPFLWAILTRPAQRRELFRSALRDIGRVFIFALVLDTTYQLIVLGTFYILQAIIVAMACAILPYILFRGIAARLSRVLSRQRSGPPRE